MSKYTVISDISETLQKLLEDNINKELVTTDNIVLSSPAEIEGDTSSQLSLFLYQVVENSYLKNQEMQKANSDCLQPPPLTLDLFYLLTPYAKDKKNELHILGRAMQIFYDHAILRGSILQGCLTETDEELRLILHPLSLDEQIKLWNAFSEKPFKLSVCYQVTPVKIDSTQKMKVKRVTKKEIRYSQLSVEK